MTWSRFDDAARTHPKAALAGNDAWALWVAGVMFANQFGTDGFIPDSALPQLMPCAVSKARARALAERLCEARLSADGAGLFARDDERGGYQIHGFLEWNPSKAETDSKRNRDRIRKMSARTDDGRRADSARTDDGRRADSARIPSHARERAPARAPAGRAGLGSGSPEGGSGGDPLRSDVELPCPLDLAERFPAYAEMSLAIGATEAQLLRAAGEFVSYWTIGAGAGRRRAHWARKLREHLRRQALEGRLPPPDPGDDPDRAAKLAERDRRLAQMRAEDEAAAASLAARAPKGPGRPAPRPGADQRAAIAKLVGVSS